MCTVIIIICTIIASCKGFGLFCRVLILLGGRLAQINIIDRESRLLYILISCWFAFSWVCYCEITILKFFSPKNTYYYSFFFN